MTAYTNIIEDQFNNKLICLYRDHNGVLCKHEREADYSAFVEIKDIDADTRKALFNAVGVGKPIKSIKEDGQYYRINWHSYNDRKNHTQGDNPFTRRGIKTYEGDVNPIRRYLSDYDVEIAKPIIGFLDIETDSRVPFDRKEEARVLSWTLCNEDETIIETGLLEYDNNESEKKLITAFWKACEKYDVLTAWNGDFFDFVVLQARAKYYQLGIKFRRWLYLDQLVLFKRMNTASESGEEKQSYKLNDIAQAVIGEAKDEFNSRFTWQEWSKGGEARERLLKYNIKDTLLLSRLEKKTGYIKLFQTLCEACYGFCESRFLNPSRQLDGFMLKLGNKKGIRFPTRIFDESDEEETEYKGAYVMEPQKGAGILKGVHVCDFSSLYPSIMLTWNMSPETKEVISENYCTSPSTKVRFSNREGAILPTALGQLISLRKEWNNKKSSLPPGTPEWYDADRKSTAYKVAANSFYGVVGSQYSRYYDRQIAESVTQNGQWLIKKTIEQAAIRKWGTVYGDTDSVFVTGCTEEEFRDFTEWCNNTYYPQILNEYGCKNNYIKLAYEKEFKWLVFTSAKRYVGIYTHYKGKRATEDSKPEVKGLEYKRGDTLKIARKLQDDIIKLFTGMVDDPKYYIDIIERVMFKTLNEELQLDEVKISKGMSKAIELYDTTKGSLPHIRVAKIIQERGEQIGKGTKIEYIVTDSSRSPIEVIPAEDWSGNCDRYYLWEKLIYPPSYRLLVAMFPHLETKFDYYSKVRPKESTSVRRRKIKEENGQGNMFSEITNKPSPPKFDLSHVNIGVSKIPSRTGPLVIELENKHIKRLGRLNEILKENPGTREVIIECKLQSSTVVMNVPHKVSVTPTLRKAIANLLEQ